MTHRIFYTCKAPARSSWDICCVGADAGRSKHGSPPPPTSPNLGGQEEENIACPSTAALSIPKVPARPDSKPHRSDSSPARPTAETRPTGGQSTLDAWQRSSFSPSPQPGPPSPACLRLARPLTALLPPSPSQPAAQHPPSTSQQPQQPPSIQHPSHGAMAMARTSYMAHGRQLAQTVRPLNPAMLPPPMPITAAAAEEFRPQLRRPPRARRRRRSGQSNLASGM